MNVNHFVEQTQLRLTHTSSKRVTFAKYTRVYILPEYYRYARRGTWILRRRIFDKRVKHLETLLEPIIRKHLLSIKE
jgi:hypothetical protein